jgi:hypothetical protein
MYAHCNVVELDSEASLPCTFGGSSYYGLYDIIRAINVISYRFYFSIQDELEQAKLKYTNMTIMLANKLFGSLWE